MTELVLRFAAVIIEASFEYIGYYTARALVPLITLGRCRVATPDNIYELSGPSKEDGIRPATAATLGILFWLFIAVVAGLVFAGARAR